jgi:outer membrane protein assembly factor BamB
MPSITRRRLLGGGVAAAAGAYGAARLSRSASDAAFDPWTPAPGTWPLRRYDPANTAHNPTASPPRERPSPRELASAPSTAARPAFRPLVGPEHVVVYGSGVAVYPRGGGTARVASDATTPLAGVGPDGRLHTVGRASGGADAPSVVVGYGADDVSETYRHSLDADEPKGMVLGKREVYVGTVDGEIRAIDPDGGQRWHVGGVAPALGGGRLYAAGALDGTVAYAERSGLDRHTRNGPERVWSAGPVDGFLHLPAVADGRLVVGTYAERGGVVAGFDAEAGERLWTPRPLGTDVSTPAVVGDRGYTAVGTGGSAGFVVALDLATGETVWRDETGWPAFAPVVGGDTLVVAGTADDADGADGGSARVRAYDRAEGDVLWTHAFDAGRPGGLALVEDRVLVTAGTSLYELASRSD